MAYTKTVFKDYQNPPLSAEELNKMQNGIAEGVNQRIPIGKEVTVTLLASSWISSGSSYTYTLNLPGVTATSTQEFLPPLSANATMLKTLQEANIQDGGQNTDQVFLVSYGVVPKTNITLRVIMRGEASKNA